MSYELKGKLIVKGDTQDVSDKFRKREFVLEKSEESNGNTFTDVVKFQLTQKQCGLLDKFNVGDEVNVHFNIKGTKWEKNGLTSYFTNLDAWKIEEVENGSSSSQSTRVNPLESNENIEQGTDDDFFGDEPVDNDVESDLPF